jgi:hypothetical protein
VRGTLRCGALFERYLEWRDPVDREMLVERFLPLARALARRYQRAVEPVDDLVQRGENHMATAKRSPASTTSSRHSVATAAATREQARGISVAALSLCH